MGWRLGDPADPLLVSVRSGGVSSMPGMMGDRPDVGAPTTSRWSGLRPRVATSGSPSTSTAGCSRCWQHGARCRERRALVTVWTRSRPSAGGLGRGPDRRGPAPLVEQFTVVIREHTGTDFPGPAREQLRHTIRAVSSRGTPRAALYRRHEQIPDDLGTAVNIQAMVFGNRGETSGSGVLHARPGDRRAGRKMATTCQNAQGEDVVAGIRNTIPLADLARLDPASTSS